MKSIIESGRAALAALTLLAATAVGGAIFPTAAYANEQDDVYAQVWTTIHDRYMGTLPAGFGDWQGRFNGQLNSDQDLSAAVGALLKAVGGDDAVSALDADGAESWIRASRGGFKGIGMQFQMLKTASGPVQIIKVFDPGIALVAGDAILAVNDVSVVGRRLDQFAAELSGNAGSLVRFTVKRGGATVNVVVPRNASGNIDIEMKTDDASVSVEVQSVVDGSPAQAAGLQKGDLIRKVADLVVSWKTSDRDIIAAITAIPLGTSFNLSVERAGVLQDVPLATRIVPRKDLNVDADVKPSDLFSQWSLGFWNLDSVNIPAYLDEEFIPKIATLPAGVLDLRVKQGWNPEITAQVLARFTTGDGTVLSYATKEAGKAVVISYKVVGDQLLEVSPNGTRVVSKLAHRFSGKFAVTIDGSANSVASYIARVIQKAGVAKVVGIAPAPADKVYSTVVFGHGIAIRVHTGNLLMPDGTAFGGITPDVTITGRDFVLPSDGADALSGM